MIRNDTIHSAMTACESQAKRHYENFPTASRLLPGPQRQATAVIYSFARTADDIVDEGNLTAPQRHAALAEFTAQLQQLKAGKPASSGLFLALAETIRAFDLPFTPFEKLLSAFRDDIDVLRYPHAQALLNYCTRSANPIGELVLRLHGHCTPDNLACSDQICTALQLINFIQDLDSDLRQRNRLYIPLDELADSGATENDLLQRKDNTALRNLIAKQIDRAETMLHAGTPLLANVDWRLRQVLKLTLLGGMRIIKKLRARDSIYTRPVLTRIDLAPLLLGCIYSRQLAVHGRLRK